MGIEPMFVRPRGLWAGPRSDGSPATPPGCAPCSFAPGQHGSKRRVSFRRGGSGAESRASNSLFQHGCSSFLQPRVNSSPTAGSSRTVQVAMEQ